MPLTGTMRMIARLVKMIFFHVLVEVVMFMRVSVEVHMYMTLGTVNMAMRVQEVANDMPVVLVHLLFMQDPVEKFMGHQCQW